MHNNQPMQGLYDIYDITYIPFWQTRPFIIAFILLILGLFGLSVWWYLKRRKERITPPWEKALTKLVHLIPDENNTHAFYERLTTILKQYLEQRYHFSLAEKTDEEMVDYLEELGIPQSQQPPLKKFFSRAVAYKFGKASAAITQMSADVQTVTTFIQLTTPHEKGQEQP